MEDEGFCVVGDDDDDDDDEVEVVGWKYSWVCFEILFYF